MARKEDKMWQLKLFVFALSVSCLSMQLQAGERNESFSGTQEKIEFFGKPFLQVNSFSLNHFSSSQNARPQPKGQKSLKKGLLFSLIVPGSGEVYAKSWLKGLVFFSIEVGSWVAYSNYHKEGKDLENQYIAYADEHWLPDQWNSWWNSLPESERAVYAHHQLPDTKTQQYYEMIGKYMKYNAGWDDVDYQPGIVETDTSQKSLFYMDLRGQSNDKLKLATTFTAIALANHVFSAMDAAWTVNRFNKKIKSSVDVNYVLINNRPQLMTRLTVTW